MWETNYKQARDNQKWIRKTMQHRRFIVVLAPLICVLVKGTSQDFAHNADSELFCSMMCFTALGDGKPRIDNG